jgi:flavin reductase (DIM6/NTAB) family NADH-FMN oxidoreductase RutF
MALDQDFRAAMRRLAATVNIITIRDGDRPMGMTATAVSSLTADPPSILICVNQSASMHNPLVGASTFCVNILHRDQHEVAKVFSDSTLREARFATGKWEHQPDAPPHLADAQAVMLCERRELITYGTHTICIGAVREVHLRDDIDPLLYIDGRFARAG